MLSHFIQCARAFWNLPQLEHQQHVQQEWNEQYVQWQLGGLPAQVERQLDYIHELSDTVDEQAKTKPFVFGILRKIPRRYIFTCLTC